MSKWFVCKGEAVLGPFSEDQIYEMKLTEDSMVWGNNLPSWLSYEKWCNRKEDIAAATDATAAINATTATDTNADQPIIATAGTADSQATIQTQAPAKAEAPKELWYYSIDKQILGPFDYEHLINKLGESSFDLKSVLLWKKEMASWATIQNCEQVYKDLRMSSKQEMSADIEGHIIISHDGEDKITTLVNISPGGLVVQELQEFSIGTNYSVEIHSASLKASFSAKAILSSIADGHFYFTFKSVPRENQSHIIEYIKSQPTKVAA